MTDNNGSQKKKILFLITKSNWGGAQRYVFDLATHLPAEQFEVVVALGGNGPLKQKLATAGIPVVTISSLQRDISLTKELTSFREIYHILKTEKPDVLHINSSKAGGMGAFLGRIAGVQRIIFTSHAWAFNEQRSRWQKPLIKFLHWLTVFLSHHTITVSNTLKRQMNWPLVHHKMSTIHNGRPTIPFLDKIPARDFLITQEPRLQAYRNDVWTGSIGELHTVKGHDVLINAFSAVRTTNDRVRHIIISDGELRTQLAQRIQERGLQEHIFLLGHINEAAQYLRAFDIYIQPSRSEALGYTVVEAAAAGLPIVASKVGGIPEIITDHEEGVLVPSEHEERLAKAITGLLTDNARAARLAQNAQKKSSQFSLERMLEKTVNAYSSTASRT